MDGRANVRDHSQRTSLPHERLLLTSGFGIASARHGEMVVVAVSGEVDLSTAPSLAAELRRAQRTGLEVVVDLEQVEFMDSSGLSVLVGFAKEAAAVSGGFSVTPGSPPVQKVFQLSGVERFVHVVPPPVRVRRAGTHATA